MRHLAKFHQNRSNGFQISRFFIFQDAGRRHLGFQKFSNFISWRVWRAEMHHLCRDIAIFRFLKMATFRHLDLCGAYLDHPLRVLDGLYHSTRFGCNRSSSFKNMKVWMFHTFGLKTPIHASKIGVLREFDPLDGHHYKRNPKGTSLH